MAAHAVGATVVDIAESQFKKDERDDIDGDGSVRLTFFKKCEGVPGDPFRKVLSELSVRAE